MSFLLFCLFITIFIFILNYVLIVTFWIFIYYEIWILLNINCFIWNYWIIYFVTCLGVFWSVMSQLISAGPPLPPDPTRQSCMSEQALLPHWLYKQRVLMHGHQGWNVRRGLCHIYMIYIYIYIYMYIYICIWVVYSLCFVCCLFITVTWWYVWCIEWASGNHEEVQACLVTLWLFIISCYSLYKTTLGLLCSWFENNPHFHKYAMDFHV